MKIGIDIDGVLVDVRRFMLEYGTKFCYDNNIDYKINENGYSSKEIFNLDDESDNKFWNQYLELYAINELPFSFASEVINKLIKDGNEIYIITSRYPTHENSEASTKMKKIVEQWLLKHNINYNKIIFSNSDKVKDCEEFKIDLMIEDKVKNINNISKIIPVICFDTQYNKICTSNNIIRCYSWYDIYNKIRDIKFS